jgi:glycosyltransferase involved in cell wall biosynthesis
VPASPLVSIIVPAHDYERFIADALASVQTQTLDSWECIVVDDGSTDGTAAVVADIARRDPRVLLHRQKNAGLAAARNSGIERARGRYVQLLDADDMLEPKKLETHARHLEKHALVDLVYGDVRYFATEDPSMRRRSLYEPDREWMPMVSGEGHPLLDALVGANIMVVNAPLLRRKLVDRVGGFDGSLGVLEDWDYWIRCALLGARFAYLDAPETLALVRLHAASMSRDAMRMRRVAVAVRRKHSAQLPADLCERNRVLAARELAWLGVERLERGELGGAHDLAEAAREAPHARLRLRYLALSRMARWVPEAVVDSVRGRTAPRPERARGDVELSRLLSAERRETSRLRAELSARSREERVSPEQQQLAAQIGRALTHRDDEDVLVSVVMAAYDGERHIESALCSVLQQTFRGLEIVVVDDGSTDRTAAIVSEVAARDPRVVLVRQENGGQGKARNHGVRVARGALVAFIDQDDLWIDTKLEQQLETMARERADVVFSDGLLFRENAVDEQWRTFETIVGRFDGREMFRLLFLQNRIPMLSALVRKQAIIDGGMFTEFPTRRGCDDYDLWLKLAARGASFVGMERPLVRYRVHDAQASRDVAAMLRSELHVLEDWRHTQLIEPELRAARLAAIHRRLLTKLLERADMRSAAECLELWGEREGSSWHGALARTLRAPLVGALGGRALVRFLRPG